MNLRKQNISELILYPNPASTEITLGYELQKPASVSYCIYNTVGKIVNCYRVKLAGGSIIQKINIANLANGTYYILVHSEKANTEKKVFIKQDLK